MKELILDESRASSYRNRHTNPATLKTGSNPASTAGLSRNTEAGPNVGNAATSHTRGPMRLTTNHHPPSLPLGGARILARRRYDGRRETAGGAEIVRLTGARTPRCEPRNEQSGTPPRARGTNEPATTPGTNSQEHPRVRGESTVDPNPTLGTVPGPALSASNAKHNNQRPAVDSSRSLGPCLKHLCPPMCALRSIVRVSWHPSRW